MNKRIVVVLSVLCVLVGTFPCVGSELLEVEPSYAHVEWMCGYGREIGYKGRGFEVTDLDNDGCTDIVFVSMRSFILYDVTSRINIVEYVDGAYVDRWRSSDFSTLLMCLEVSDVDQDGTMEILVGGADGTLLILDGTSLDVELKEVFSNAVNDLCIDDIDGDGELEIIASIGYELVILNGNDLSVEWASFGLGRRGSTVTTANIDGDPQPEILLGTIAPSNGRVYIFDGVTHEQQWQSPMFDDEVLSIEVGDVDSDSELEILIGSSDAFEGYWQAGVHIYNAQTYVLEWEKPDSTVGTSCIAISADIDDDGTPEIVVSEKHLPGFEGGSRLLIYDGITHGLEWEERVGGMAWAFYPDSLACDDVDDDGFAELVIGKARGSLHVMNGIRHVDEWCSLYPGFRTVSICSKDIDDDGIVEVVGGTPEGYVYVLNGETMAEEWRSDLLAYDEFDMLIGFDVGDVDSDAVDEIIVGMEQGIYVFNGVDCSLEWYSGHLDYYLKTLTVADPDQNGVCEILVGGSCGSLLAYNGVTHDLEWEEAGFDDGVADIIVDDVDGDSNLELIIGSGVTHHDNHVYVLDGVTRSVEWVSDEYVQAIKRLATANVDIDPACEILLSIQSGEVHVIDGVTHATEWISDDLGIETLGLAAADVDANGITELIAGSESGLYIFSGGTFELLWSNTSFGVNELSVGNVDHDLKMEILGGDFGFLYKVEVRSCWGPPVPAVEERVD